MDKAFLKMGVMKDYMGFVQQVKNVRINVIGWFKLSYVIAKLWYNQELRYECL